MSFFVDMGTNSHTGATPGCKEINDNSFMVFCEGQQFGMCGCLDLRHLKYLYKYNLLLAVV